MVRARKFYEDNLGLVATVAEANGQWVEYEPGGRFVLTTMAPVRPAADAGDKVAFEVSDVAGLTESLRQRDPEGNAVTLCQTK